MVNLLQNRILNITEEFRRGTFTQRCSQLSFGILCLFLLECSITGGGRYWEVGPVSIRILLGGLAAVLALPELFRHLGAYLKKPAVWLTLAFVAWLAFCAWRGVRAENRMDVLLTDIKGFMWLFLVPVLVAVVRSRDRLRTLLSWVLAVALLFNALLLSYTRSLYGALGLTALISIIAVLVLCPEGRKRTLAFLLAAVVCFGVLVTVQEFALEGSYLSFAVSRTIGKEVPTSWASQLRSQLRGEDPGDSPDDGEMDSQRSYIEVTEKSDQLRQETKDSLNVYIQRSPIIGCGLGASAANRDKGVDEYFYLDMLARTGVVGLLLYMLPFGYVVAWCLRRRELLRECPEGAAVVCGLCTFWIVTWFNPWMNAVLGIAWYAVTLSVPTALEEHSI